MLARVGCSINFIRKPYEALSLLILLHLLTQSLCCVSMVPSTTAVAPGGAPAGAPAGVPGVAADPAPGVEEAEEETATVPTTTTAATTTPLPTTGCASCDTNTLVQTPGPVTCAIFNPMNIPCFNAQYTIAMENGCTVPKVTCAPVNDHEFDIIILVLPDGGKYFVISALNEIVCLDGSFSHNGMKISAIQCTNT